jgi:tetratricopeptide (TPR) repeat protein
VLVEKIPMLALSLISSAITLEVQRNAMVPLHTVSPGERVGNAFVAYLSYLGKALWPSHLAIFYPLSERPLWVFLAAAAAIVALTLAVLRVMRRRPYLAVGWLWFLGTLVPVIGLVQVGLQSMADRYMYMPLVGLAIMAAWGVPDLVGRFRMAPALVACATLLSLAVVTWRQIGVWGDELTLFRHALEVTRDNFVAHTRVGVLLQQQGRLDEAITHYRKAEQIDPGYEAIHYNLGLALAQQGRSDSALVHLSEAVRLRPGYADARNNLGGVLVQLGRTPEATEQFQEVLRLDPDHWKARHNLGQALLQEGKFDAAIAEFEQALRIKPDYALARASLERARAARRERPPGP